jgi:hypothetical protein
MESGRIIPERKIAEMKPETEKVGIEYVYPQTTTISILPPIILLLLSEGYGSAWQADLSFQLRKTKKIALVGSGRRSEDRKRKRSYTI